MKRYSYSLESEIFDYGSEYVVRYEGDRGGLSLVEMFGMAYTSRNRMNRGEIADYVICEYQKQLKYFEGKLDRMARKSVPVESSEYDLVYRDIREAIISILIIYQEDLGCKMYVIDDIELCEVRGCDDSDILRGYKRRMMEMWDPDERVEIDEMKLISSQTLRYLRQEVLD